MTLTIDELAQMLDKLTAHAVQVNTERNNNGLELKRFVICADCREISDADENDCECRNDA